MALLLLLLLLMVPLAAMAVVAVGVATVGLILIWNSSGNPHRLASHQFFVSELRYEDDGEGLSAADCCHSSQQRRGRLSVATRYHHQSSEYQSFQSDASCFPLLLLQIASPEKGLVSGILVAGVDECPLMRTNMSHWEAIGPGTEDYLAKTIGQYSSSPLCWSRGGG